MFQKFPVHAEHSVTLANSAEKQVFRITLKEAPAQLELALAPY